MVLMKSRRGTWIHIAVLLTLTEAVYVRPSMLSGRATLVGLDYIQLHARRIKFVRDALFGPAHTLPAWYPHELLGAPFTANLQNFPWIPTRLVLLFLDPAVAYGAGVALAAALAALFTFLYCRRAGLSDTTAAMAGWTFACAGYFACRVTAGHLPLLEAYPALPLLLWLCDRALSADRARYRVRDLLLLAAGCTCVALAGHPQVPAYAIATALLYVLVRGTGRHRRLAVYAMILGVGMALAAWWPMLLLAQRSTRVLGLAPPANDISLPYARLLALLRPGIDGWPDIIDLSDQHEFDGYPMDAYFWDTTAYVGLIPLIVVAAMLARCIARKRLPQWPWSFLAVVGVGALLLALPLADPLRRMVPGTFLRSPARLLYITTFAASVALGCGINAVLNSGVMRRWVAQAVVATCILFHVFDLGGFTRVFVVTVEQQPKEPPPFAQTLDREVKDGRVALSGDLVPHYDDRYDDVGVFDSLLLANPYRAILGLNGDPLDLNIQRVDGGELRVPALQAAGVRFVVTSTERADLPLVSTGEELYLYRVPDPAPRAAFYAPDQIEYVGRHDVLSKFLAGMAREKLLLPVDIRPDVSLTHVSVEDRGSNSVSYKRPSSDEIRLQTAGNRGGFVEVLESYDPGWHGEVDGVPAPVVPANGFSIAVPVAAGRHAIRLWYETPGRVTGGVLSAMSALLLCTLLWNVRVQRARLAPHQPELIDCPL